MPLRLYTLDPRLRPQIELLVLLQQVFDVDRKDPHLLGTFHDLIEVGKALLAWRLAPVLKHLPQYLGVWDGIECVAI